MIKKVGGATGGDHGRRKGGSASFPADRGGRESEKNGGGGKKWAEKKPNWRRRF